MAFNSGPTAGDNVFMAGLNVESQGGRWAPAAFEETLLNDSNKTLDLDAGALLIGNLQAFWFTSIHLEITLTGTTGTRTFQWQILDDSGDLIYQHGYGSGFNGSAGDSFNIDQAMGNEILTAGSGRRDRMPDRMMLRPDWQIRIRDSAAIDAAADDMIVQIMGICYFV